MRIIKTVVMKKQGICTDCKKPLVVGRLVSYEPYQNENQEWKARFFCGSCGRKQK